MDQIDQVQELIKLAPAGTFTEVVEVVSRQREGEREVENKHTHYIREFTYLQFFRVLGHTQRIYAAIQALGLDLDELLKEFQSPSLKIVDYVLQIGSVVGNDVAALTALAIGKPVEYLGTVDPMDGVRLTIATFKVNVDFFVQRILPMMENLPKPTTETTETAESATDGQMS